jgi:hypothetical protein
MSWIDRATIETAETKAAERLLMQESEIRSRYSLLLLDVAKPYTPEERETWKTQEEEANQFKSDSESPCPMIRAMASQRGISVDTLADKILNNAAEFRLATGNLLGQQQAELDALGIEA